ncbi:MAG TPA: chromate transporter [Anaerolineales bacterium]|nr:chromate transporter [Anaerolineales bacterium]
MNIFGGDAEILFTLFWTFIKINLLSTSGPASLGILHELAVGSFLTEGEFIEAVGFSTLLPGSDALQLAMYIGSMKAGIAGGMVSIVGALLPPTLLMFIVVMLLHRIRKESWMASFVEGLTPAVSVLMFFVAWKIFLGSDGFNWQTVIIGLASFAALYFKAPAPIVLLAAGIAGVFLY